MKIGFHKKLKVRKGKVYLVDKKPSSSKTIQKIYKFDVSDEIKELIEAQKKSTNTNIYIEKIENNYYQKTAIFETVKKNGKELTLKTGEKKEFKYGICPNCKHIYFQEDQEYCEKCGVKLN